MWWGTGPGTYQNNNGVTATSGCSDTSSVQSGVASQTGSSHVGSPVNPQYVAHYCTDKAGNPSSIGGNYYVQYKSRAPVCGVELYRSCRNYLCGVESYRSCATSACGTYQCNCNKTIQGYYIYSRGSRTYGFCADSKVPGYSCGSYVETSHPCFKHGYYDCMGRYTCSTCNSVCENRACGVKSYYSCRKSVCGVELYNSCWHY